MKAVYAATMAVVLLAVSIARAQTDSSDALRATADRLAIALVTGDFATAADLTYGRLVAAMGGKDQVARMMREQAEKLQSDGARLIDMQFGVPSASHAVGGELHATVPCVARLSVPGGHLEVSSFYYAVSVDSGRTWKLLDGGRMTRDSLRQVFPAYAGEPKLPPATKPRFVPLNGAPGARESEQLRRRLESSLVEGKLNSFPSGTRAHDVHKDTIYRLVTTTKLVDYLLHKFNDAPSEDSLSSYAISLMEDLLGDGMRRLSDDHLLLYLKSDLALIKACTVELCGAVAKGRSDSAQRRRLLLSVSDDVVEEHYVALEAAVRAALDGRPVPSMTVAQEEAVTEYLAHFLSDKLTAEELEAAALLENPSTASAVPDQVACKIAVLGYEAVFAATGDLQRWVARTVATAD